MLTRMYPESKYPLLAVAIAYGMLNFVAVSLTSTGTYGCVWVHMGTSVYE